MPTLKNIDVRFVSLVKKGANRKEIIWKDAEGKPPIWVKDVKISKTDELGVAYCIAMVPDEADTQGDAQTAEEIRKAAYGFMEASRTGVGADVSHSFLPEDNCFIAESWIIQKNDAVFPEEKEGCWAVGIKIDDEQIREEILKGEITGFSIGGKAVRVADPIEKAADFDEKIRISSLWEAVKTLEDTIYDIQWDGTEIDQKAAIAESIDQFKALVIGDMIIKQDKPGVLASLKNIFKKQHKEENMNLKEVQAEIKKQMAGVDKQEGDDPALSAKDIAILVVKSVSAVVAPIQKELEELKKRSPGSTQGEEADLEKAHKDEDAIVTAILKGVCNG